MAPAPHFDPEIQSPRIMPTPRWIRVRVGDEWVADSRRAVLLVRYGPGKLPTYCFPPDDVRTELLKPSGGPEAEEAVAHDIRVGDEVLEAAAQHFADPPPELAELRGQWSFTWDGRVTWLEEAMQIAVHARDPAKRVDAVPSERHVRVELDGVVVAESRRPHALFETTLPTRWYLPAEAVRQELLEPSETVTVCPYKGTARYWSVRVGDVLHRDLAWSYPEPIPENPRIAGLVCFFNEKVDLMIDGEREPRPRTPWS